MKIHNPNNLDLEVDLSALRAMIRGDMDPLRQALEERREHPGESSARRKSDGFPLAGKPVQNGANLPSATVATLPAAAKQTATLLPGRPSQVANRQAAQPVKQGPTAEELEQTRLNLLTRRKALARIIQQCEALELVNPGYLAMSDYPSTERLLMARKWRDFWFVACLLCAGLAFMGWWGILNPWVSGIAAGGLVFCLTLIWRPVRQFFFRKDNSFPALMAYRKTLEFRAMNHIRMLEGTNGLAWQCQAMRDRRKTLAEKRYERMALLSRQGLLLKAMRNIAAFRFYLQYLVEARHSFVEVKKEYLEVSATLVKDFGEF
jgi:hypothetical protein